MEKEKKRKKKLQETVAYAGFSLSGGGDIINQN